MKRVAIGLMLSMLAATAACGVGQKSETSALKGIRRGHGPLIPIYEFKRNDPVAIYYSKSPFPASREYFRTGSSFNLFLERPRAPFARECQPRPVVSCLDIHSATTYLGLNRCEGETRLKERLGFICTRKPHSFRTTRLDTYQYYENWGGTGWWRYVYTVSARPLMAPWTYKFRLGFTP